MFNITDLKPKIEKGNLIATFKLNGEDRVLTLEPFYAGVLYKEKLTLEEYTEKLIQKECLNH